MPEPLLRSLPPAALRAFSRYAEHQATEEARPDRRQERLENLRFRSTAKTLARRLEAAVAEGDDARVADEHKQLVSLARPGCRARRDPQEHRGAPQGAGRPARLRLAAPSASARVGVTSTSARSNSSSPGEPAAALERQVELGEPDDRVRQLVRREVPRVRERLLGGVRMQLQLRRRVARADALRRERLARAHAVDVTREQRHEARQLARARPLEQRLDRTRAQQRRRASPTRP